MTRRIHDGILKMIILVVLFTILMLQTLVADAQVYPGKNQKQYKGYVNREPGEVNYTQAEALYPGKIKQVNATVGIGIELKLKDAYDSFLR